jgi:hypothetical protein
VTSRLTYRYATQCHNAKTISLIEQQLMNARQSVTTLRFDGRLEATVGSSTEIGKERFLTLLGQQVEEHGQETLYHAKNSNNKVVKIIEDSHNFTNNMLISEFEIQSDPDKTDYAAFDEIEMQDIALSRLVVESLLTLNFNDKIVIRHEHLPDFKLYPGSVLLMMGLETCNTSVSYDIDGAN